MLFLYLFINPKAPLFAGSTAWQVRRGGLCAAWPRTLGAGGCWSTPPTQPTLSRLDADIREKFGYFRYNILDAGPAHWLCDADLPRHPELPPAPGQPHLPLRHLGGGRQRLRGGAPLEHRHRGQEGQVSWVLLFSISSKKNHS